PTHLQERACDTPQASHAVLFDAHNVRPTIHAATRLLCTHSSAHGEARPFALANPRCSAASGHAAARPRPASRLALISDRPHILRRRTRGQAALDLHASLGTSTIIVSSSRSRS